MLDALFAVARVVYLVFVLSATLIVLLWVIGSLSHRNKPPTPPPTQSPKFLPRRLSFSAALTPPAASHLYTPSSTNRRVTFSLTPEQVRAERAKASPAAALPATATPFAAYAPVAPSPLAELFPRTPRRRITPPVSHAPPVLQAPPVLPAQHFPPARRRVRTRAPDVDDDGDDAAPDDLNGVLAMLRREAAAAASRPVVPHTG